MQQFHQLIFNFSENKLIFGPKSMKYLFIDIFVGGHNNKKYIERASFRVLEVIYSHLKQKLKLQQTKIFT